MSDLGDIFGLRPKISGRKCLSISGVKFFIKCKYH
jgi:hypothetical protein